MKLREVALIVILSSGVMAAQTLHCDLSGYKPN
jgi:hypothetical protein